MKNQKAITILGGGPAGLAAGYYARKNKQRFHIYEGAGQAGGNCRTLNINNFYFDTGAHRWHNKNPELTKEINSLLGGELYKINVPSRIYTSGKYLDFPLTPLDLLRKMGSRFFLKSSADLIKNKIQNHDNKNFKSVALKSYGSLIAEKFLFNYSEKLWGLPAEQLSPHIAGNRMKGLDLTTFLFEAIGGKTIKTKHIDGEFYYPKKGIGQIFNCISASLSPDISTHSKVTEIVHDQGKIISIKINNTKSIFVNEVINSLPLSYLLQILNPAPPREILNLASALRYRNLILVIVFLDKPSVSTDATIYFPDKNVVFTRIYEPRNRSAFMAPHGKTSLVAEIPCFQSDGIWKSDSKDLLERVKNELFKTGLISQEEVLNTEIFKLPNAYPVLEADYLDKTKAIFNYLNGFQNLHNIGRSAQFRYTHIHDIFKNAEETIVKLTN